MSGYDVGGHADYILTILEERRLPHPLEGWSTFHPPLYYWVGSLVWSLLEPLGPRAVVAGLRAIGAVASLAAGLVTFLLVLRLGAGWFVAWVATALVLFVPCAQMATAMVGNEALAAGFAALALPPLLTLHQNPRSWRIAGLAGFLAGLALATKFTGVFVAAACVFPFARADFDRRMLRALAVGVLTGGLVAGPFLLRNVVLTGTPFPMTRDLEPMKSTEEASVLRPRKLVDYLWLNPECLRRPSIHHVRGTNVSAPRPNRAMTNVWGLTYASIWYDAFAQRIPIADHRDGIRSGPLLALLGIIPTSVMLLGFVLALIRCVLHRGRSDDAPLVVIWLTGLASFVTFTWQAPSLTAVKGSYLLPLAVPGAVFFAGGVMWLCTRLRTGVLLLSAAAALAAALVFTDRLIFPA
jgi:hypothetical protein